jgi:hypothetical protein
MILRYFKIAQPLLAFSLCCFIIWPNLAGGVADRSQIHFVLRQGIEDLERCSGVLYAIKKYDLRGGTFAEQTFGSRGSPPGTTFYSDAARLALVPVSTGTRLTFSKSGEIGDRESKLLRKCD